MRGASVSRAQVPKPLVRFTRVRSPHLWHAKTAANFRIPAQELFSAQRSHFEITIASTSQKSPDVHKIIFPQICGFTPLPKKGGQNEAKLCRTGTKILKNRHFSLGEEPQFYGETILRASRLLCYSPLQPEIANDEILSPTSFILRAIVAIAIANWKKRAVSVQLSSRPFHR